MPETEFRIISHALRHCIRTAPLCPPYGEAALHTVLATEFIDAAGRVDDFLLAGVERVAGRAHFDMQLIL